MHDFEDIIQTSQQAPGFEMTLNWRRSDVMTQNRHQYDFINCHVCTGLFPRSVVGVLILYRPKQIYLNFDNRKQESDVWGLRLAKIVLLWQKISALFVMPQILLRSS